MDKIKTIGELRRAIAHLPDTAHVSITNIDLQTGDHESDFAFNITTENRNKRTTVNLVPTDKMTEEDRQRINSVKILAGHVSEDPEEAFNKLTIQSEIDASVLADDVVLMWEPLVGRYTVEELISIIS